MKTLEQRISQVLQNNDGKCLDNEVERQEVADALFDMMGEWLNERDEYFPITALHRGDLEELGYDSSRVDDAAMIEVAHQMADGYCEGAFWTDLEMIAEELRIPKRR